MTGLGPLSAAGPGHSAFKPLRWELGEGGSSGGAVGLLQVMEGTYHPVGRKPLLPSSGPTAGTACPSLSSPRIPRVVGKQGGSVSWSPRRLLLTGVRALGPRAAGAGPQVGHTAWGPDTALTVSVTFLSFPRYWSPHVQQVGTRLPPVTVGPGPCGPGLLCWTSCLSWPAVLTARSPSRGFSWLLGQSALGGPQAGSRGLHFLPPGAVCPFCTAHSWPVSLPCANSLPQACCLSPQRGAACTQGLPVPACCSGASGQSWVRAWGSPPCGAGAGVLA